MTAQISQAELHRGPTVDQVKPLSMYSALLINMAEALLTSTATTEV